MATIVKGVATTLALAVLWTGCGDAPHAPDTAAVSAPLAGGTDDVRTDGTGNFLDDLEQWRRDATVAIVGGCDAAAAPIGSSFCSGVLVSPRVVLTNSHCISAFPNMAVSFSPINPGIGGTAPPGTPSPFCVPAVGCATHPGSLRACGDGLGGAGSNPDRDVAALILDRRMDHGVAGTRTQSYNVIPATIVAHDPEILGVQSPDYWNLRRVWHMGYGPIDGCFPTGGTIPPLRQVANQSIEFGNWIILGWSSSMALFGVHGLPGDSGGPVYLKDGSAIGEVVGVYRGSTSFDVFPVCTPEPSLVRDHVVRLTHSAMQSFLAGVLDVTIDGPGVASAAPGVYVKATGTPALWTGDVDCPPATEPAARAAAGCASTDPDGDGMVGVNDNCWGVSNIEQAVSDASTGGTCVDAAGNAVAFACLNDGGSVERYFATDGDGWLEPCDNCPLVPNLDQIDTDGDGDGDACDFDDDDDGVADVFDAAPTDPTRCTDDDLDTCDDCASGRYDPADDGTDGDGDGLCDAGDPCGDLTCSFTEGCSFCPGDCGICEGPCGDGVCAAGEDCRSCAPDCGACAGDCGDGACAASEDCVSCPMDCGRCAAECGDGVCTASETCAGCPGDCGECAPGCGNGVCAPDESCSGCPQDCGRCASSCGDGVCAPDEDCIACPSDCGPCAESCGDGACAAGEHCVNCPVDCGACAAVCGDGTCTAGQEHCGSCASDCGSCPPGCGNGVCTPSESCGSCPADCGECAPTCGDGACGAGEDCATCTGDCGPCTASCGDAVCQDSEHCVSCPDDCGACAPACGNGSCEDGESCVSCAGDCGACAPGCGNGQCGGGETCVNCPLDCGDCT